jgi:hypothetical protein
MILSIIVVLLGAVGCKQMTFNQASDKAVRTISHMLDGTATTTEDAQKLLTARFGGQSRETVQQFLAIAPGKRSGFDIVVSKHPEFDILRLRRIVEGGEMAVRIVFSYDSSDHVKKCSVSFEFM